MIALFLSMHDFTFVPACQRMLSQRMVLEVTFNLKRGVRQEYEENNTNGNERREFYS